MVCGRRPLCVRSVRVRHYAESLGSEAVGKGRHRGPDAAARRYYRAVTVLAALPTNTTSKDSSAEAETKGAARAADTPAAELPGRRERDTRKREGCGDPDSRAHVAGELRRTQGGTETKVARGAGRCRRPDASATRGRQGRRSPLPARRPAGSPRRSPGCPRPALPTSNRHLRPRTPGCLSLPSGTNVPSAGTTPVSLPDSAQTPPAETPRPTSAPCPPMSPPALSGFPAGTEPVPSAPRGPGTRRERDCGEGGPGGWGQRRGFETPAKRSPLR